MAINFPTSLDNFTNPSSGNTLDSPSHSLQHSDINDAVEAMQRKVGVGSSVAGSASAGQVLTISAAGTSTWSTPTPGGLVQIVPTSVAVGSGSGSADANGAVTFSGASSISLNGCFSSSYDTYRIIGSFQGTANGALNLRLRASGTDTTTGYYGNNIYMLYTSTAVNGGASNNLTNIGISSVVSTANARSVLIFDAGNPNLAQFTTINAQSFQADSYFTTGGWKADNLTQYDGFTLYPASGTITGTIRVYGYKN